jgi:DNA-binding transcriptional MerR regulator
VYTRRELSKLTGAGFDALRYYEKLGLLTPPVRGDNGYRQYGDEAVIRLKFIRGAKQCGFTLGEIKKTLDGIEKPEDCGMSTDEVIDLKLKELDEKIAGLNRMKEMLLSIQEPLRNKSCTEIETLDFL